MLKNVLLTGQSGIGKTTLIHQAVRRLGDRASGFYTEEVREGNRRIGFDLVTLTGQREPLARIGRPDAHQVGDYGVDLDVLERLGVPALHRALQRGRVAIIDEIGPLEVACEPLREAILACLDGEPPVLGCLARTDDPFLTELAERKDTLVVEVTRENRDTLLDRIFSGLELPRESIAETQRNIERKRRKAERYASEDRLTLHSFTAEFRSDHSRHTVALDDGRWHCSCSWHLKYGTCSHIMATRMMLERRLTEAAVADTDEEPGTPA